MRTLTSGVMLWAEELLQFLEVQTGEGEDERGDAALLHGILQTSAGDAGPGPACAARKDIAKWGMVRKEPREPLKRWKNSLLLRSVADKVPWFNEERYGGKRSVLGGGLCYVNSTERAGFGVRLETKRGSATARRSNRRSRFPRAAGDSPPLASSKANGMFSVDA